MTFTFDKTNRIRPETIGLTVEPENQVVSIDAEDIGFVIPRETIGMNANNTNPGGDIQVGYWAWGSGEFILFGSGEEVEL